MFLGAILVSVATAGHALSGNVDIALAGWLLLGFVPGVLIGSRLLIKIPNSVLRGALSAALLLAGAKLL